jgi:SdpI/YfhL protein family
MSARRSLDARSIAVIVIGYVAGLIAYPKLPGPFLEQALFARNLVAFGLPSTALAIYALFHSLWTHDRVRSGNGAFEATYSAIVFCLVLFVVALHTLVMAELVGVYMPKVWAMRAVVVLLGLTFVAVGNLLPRTRPNVAIGVRTRQTLANGQTWTQVHRVGGYVTVFWGVIIAASAVALSGPVLGLAIGLSGVAAVTILVATYRRVARA